jgi:hypothetical protein
MRRIGILLRHIIGIAKHYAANLNPLASPRLRTVIMHSPIPRLLFTGMYDFVLHETYWLIATLRYRGSRDTPMRSTGFMTAMASWPKRFGSRFDVFQEVDHSPPRPVNYRGMLAVKAISANQIFFDDFSRDDIEEIRRMAIDSGIEAVAKRFLGCEVSSYNIRAWRYFPHATCRQDRHRDNLPPHAIKAMFFRGEVDKNRGALSVRDYAGQWNVIEGRDVAVIFDSNRLEHESDAPVVGWRDCIELTYMPAVGASHYQASGPEAEHPLNPFADWHSPASGVVPYKARRLIGV